MERSITRKPYATDLTDAQWELLAPFILFLTRLAPFQGSCSS